MCCRSGNALMAAAADITESGGICGSIYDRQMIYQWIDNIRQMGNLQSFREDKKEKTGTV